MAYFAIRSTGGDREQMANTTSLKLPSSSHLFTGSVREKRLLRTELIHLPLNLSFSLFFELRK